MHLKQILVELKYAHVDQFSNNKLVDDLINTIQMKAQQWSNSAAASLQQLDRNETKRKRKAQAAAQLAKKRAKQFAQAWEDREIVAGDFIKVVGTRDGHGVREVINVEQNHVICRKWIPVHEVTLCEHRFDPIALRALGYLIVDNNWWAPDNQMTVHDFSKVVGKL